MRRKGLLAVTLAFCVGLSGAVPVGAVSGNVETAVPQTGQETENMTGDGSFAQDGQEGQAEDGIFGDHIFADDPQTLEGSAVSQGDAPILDGPAVSQGDAPILDGPTISQEGAAPQGPAASENTADGAEEDLPEGSSVSEDRAAVSENEVLPDDYVGSPKWVRDGKQYKLQKPDGSGFFSEADGLVQVKGKGDTYVYYAFDAEGHMRTGSHDLSINVGTKGVYHFLSAQECQGVKDPTPENSKLGQMVTQSGWYHVTGEDRWLYLKENGVWDRDRVGKQKVSDGKTYFLKGKDGAVEKDVWKKVDGNTYYFGTNGAMAANGMKKINGDTYYFDAEGVMAAGRFVTVDKGKQYYFENNGKRYEKTGWRRLKGSFYYFDTDYSRRIKTGWQKIKEKNVTGYYYFTAAGQMYAEKLFKVKDKDGSKYTYYVDSKGKMVTGLRTINGKLYFFRKKAEGKKPIGSACKGWQKIGGYWYYFNKDQQAESKELVKIDNKYYSFGTDGRMYKGGWKKIKGKLYHFQKQTGKKRNGYAATSTWLQRGAKWYYANPKGAMRTDAWIKYKGKSYYLGKDGVMVTNKWKQRDGKWGYLDADGVFSQNWIKINGKWKYAKGDGKFAKGWTYIVQNGTRYKYFFNNNGYLIQDVRGKVSGPYMLKVDRRRNQITVYARDTDGQYNIPVVAMPCSVGLPATPTPTGRYTCTRAGRWQILMGPTWGQYASNVVDGIFIHSVSGPAANIYSLPANEWNKLGREAASHGCIRVAVIDAKWIYENCNGSAIEIQDYTYAGPFDHKAYRQITAAYNWDPTDPAGRGYL